MRVSRISFELRNTICELGLEETSKINFHLTNIDFLILNVQYRICFPKMCEMVWGAFFDKNSFILETKLNVLKNIFLKVERKVSFP